MRIAMLGTRGVPARYGGFETAVEEIGRRLVERGHDVVVYCRGEDDSPRYLGMRRVTLPALRHPVTETLSHTAVSVAHLVAHRTDVALVFNAANAPLLPVIRAARIPVAVHVDGLEWKRAKWGPNGRRYYLANERLAVALADELIADAVGIQEYYRTRYGTDSVNLAYGAPVLPDGIPSRLHELDLAPGGYHLVVARTEPENQVDLIMDGYSASSAERPLVVVGTVPYPSEHESGLRRRAENDSRIRMLGSLWDQEMLDSLYLGSASYLHGHTVGGTNPSLLRAMGAGANVLAWDVSFNKEVLEATGRLFAGRAELTHLIEDTEKNVDRARGYGRAARERVQESYNWDDVTAGYESLCEDLRWGKRTRQSRMSSRRVRA